MYKSFLYHFLARRPLVFVARGMLWSLQMKSVTENVSVVAVPLKNLIHAIPVMRAKAIRIANIFLGNCNFHFGINTRLSSQELNDNRTEFFRYQMQTSKSQAH